MNIVHLIFNIRPGGMENFLIDLAAAQNIDDNVTVVVVNRDNDPEMMKRLASSCNVIEINRPQRSFNPYYVIKLNRVLAQLKPEIVNFHCRRLGGLILKRKGVRYVFTCHDMLQPVGLGKRADTIVAVSNAVAQWLKTEQHLDSTIIPNGLDLSKFTKRDDSPLHTPVRLLTVARLDHLVKGQHILLKAITELKDINLQLDLIGDGPSKNYLIKMTQNLGLSKRVTFKPNCSRNELLQSLSQYDIFILPSLNEAFSIALAEALSSSLPAIVSDLEGPRQVTADRQYATFFVPGNPRDLAAKIKKVIATYPDAYARASQAPQYIKKTFNITTIAKSYRLLYNKTRVYLTKL